MQSESEDVEVGVEEEKKLVKRKHPVHNAQSMRYLNAIRIERTPRG